MPRFMKWGGFDVSDRQKSRRMQKHLNQKPTFRLSSIALMPFMIFEQEMCKFCVKCRLFFSDFKRFLDFEFG